MTCPLVQPISGIHGADNHDGYVVEHRLARNHARRASGQRWGPRTRFVTTTSYILNMLFRNMFADAEHPTTAIFYDGNHLRRGIWRTTVNDPAQSEPKSTTVA